jgi:methionine-rich copper-binding protein CopC
VNSPFTRAVVVVTLVTAVGSARPAAAAASLVKAIPEPGSVLRSVPPAVHLWFSEELSPELSGLTVWGPRGVSAIAGTGGVDPKDPTRRSMVATIRPLRAGIYTVRWRAAAAGDLAVSQGSYQFTVRP